MEIKKLIHFSFLYFFSLKGISGEKIEIDPVLKGKFSFKQKPVTYDTESIASCTLLEEKSSGISY